MKPTTPAAVLATLLFATLAGACSRGDTPGAAAPSPPQAGGLSPWTLPAPVGAAQPDLVATHDGRLLLSWMNSQPGRRHALQYASLERDGRWQGPKTIAVGASFFVNWADTPHIASTANGALWVHWLQKSADQAYSYDVMLSTSRDDGMHWSDPLRVHDDGTLTEHGFVSLYPASDDSIGIAWLDGRNMATADEQGGGAKPVQAGAHAAPAHGAMMTLRSAVFDGALQRVSESEVDASTCDCCQTDVAATAKGPLLVYRDRTAAEIRDIYATRLEGGAWRAPAPVHADNWTMPACPVNGPSVAANGDEVVVGWYTAAGGVPAVRIARSTDAGASFAAPTTLEQGDAAQGRVDIALDAKQAWVLWVREDATAQSLWLARLAPDLSRELERVQVATLQGRGRATGFPQLALHGGIAYIVWTDVVDKTPRLLGARYVPKS